MVNKSKTGKNIVQIIFYPLLFLVIEPVKEKPAVSTYYFTRPLSTGLAPLKLCEGEQAGLRN